MARRLNAHLRCRGCRMHESLCLCGALPRVETATRLVLYVHRTDARKPSNTGCLAAACLPNSEVVLRGAEGDATPPLPADERASAVLLFPHEDAVPLEAALRDARPTTLVVPDGSWRQASKVRGRVPGLADVPAVFLPPGAPSAYRLRAEAHEGRLATIEAIARAMELLEGPHVRAALEHALAAMVERTLWSRGAIAAEDVTGGIPPGAMRHEPRRPA